MNNMVGKVLRINDVSITFFPVRMTSVYGHKVMHRGELMLVLNVQTPHAGRIYTVLCKYGIGQVVDMTDAYIGRNYIGRKIDYEVVA